MKTIQRQNTNFIVKAKGSTSCYLRHVRLNFRIFFLSALLKCQKSLGLSFKYVSLCHKGKSFVLEPSGKAVQVVEVADQVAGKYESFDDLLLNYKIDGKPLIELIKDLEYGE